MLTLHVTFALDAESLFLPAFDCFDADCFDAARLFIFALGLAFALALDAAPLPDPPVSSRSSFRLISRRCEGAW